jgi:hypothetical protein
MLVIIGLSLALVSVAQVHAAPLEEMTTFLDSQIPGIRIQVNATSHTQPTKNVTVTLNLISQTNVHVDHFNLQVFGFLNGTNKLSLANFTDSNFDLNNASKPYSVLVNVPDFVWGVLYGEVKLTYSASLGGIELVFPNIITGFTMTQVENTFLENLQTQVKSLNASYSQLTEMYTNLTSNYAQLNQTYWDLYENYTAMNGNLGELDNTRRLITVLAITTVFFVATTVYLVMRKPKEIW